MTDYIYKLPVKLVSKNGRKYSEQIFKSIRKQLKSKKLIGTVGEMTFEETTDLIKNKQSLIHNAERLLSYKEMDDDNNLVFTANIELPKNYSEHCELTPMYLLEGDKVTILSVNLINKQSMEG
jgi:hypothetical protein